jgi:hypothetical protein
MIDREGKSWHDGNNDATFPRGPFAVCSDYTMYQSIADFILNFYIIGDGAIVRYLVDTTYYLKKSRTRL